MLSKNKNLTPRSKKQKHDLDQLKARIDIVREGLISNPLDIELETTINELTHEVRHLIFTENWVIPIPNNSWTVVRSFILSLNEVSASARNNNRSLHFTAQRSVFYLLGYIFNHPHFSELCERNFFDDNGNTFNIIQIMYGEVERQNHTPNLFGDLYAEGEWISAIMGFMAVKHRDSPNQKGLISALSLWESVISYSAISNSSRIPRLFKNIKEAATSNLYGYLSMPLLHPETDAVKTWKKKFTEISPPKISTLKHHEDAFKVLHGEKVDGDWASLNGSFGESLNFLGMELPDIEDVWCECIQGSVFDSMAYMYGVCAYSDSWKELKACWYLSQPDDANAQYCDHQLFTRDPHEFSQWISNHAASIDRTIDERHDLKVHIAAACTVLIGEMLDNGQSISFQLTSIASTEKLEQFLILLRTKLNTITKQLVMDAFGWSAFKAGKIKLKVDKLLAIELANCKRHITDRLKECIPDITIDVRDINLNKEDRELVYEAWNQTNHHFWGEFKTYPAVKLSFSSDIPSESIKIKFTAHESYFLSAKSGKKIHGLSFSGHAVASKLNHNLFHTLTSMANSQVSKSIEDGTWLICREDWNNNTFSQLQSKDGYDQYSDKSILIGGNQSFVIEKEAAELVLHEWTCMPWSRGEYPVVVYGFTEFSEFTTGESSLYYEFKVLKPSGVYFL